MSIENRNTTDAVAQPPRVVIEPIETEQKSKSSNSKDTAQTNDCK